MDVLPLVPAALLELFRPEHVLSILTGVVLGLIVGVIPGFGPTAMIVLLFPVLFTLDATSAIGLVVGVLAATTVSDTAPAILFGVAGEVGAQATILDGHPLGRQGKAAPTLGSSYSAAMLGGLVGAVFLMAAIPIAGALILAVGSPELFAIGVVGIAMVGSLSGRAILRGLAAGTIGLLIGMVGIDVVTATPRWTFDLLYLYDGFPIVLVAIGIFGIPELLRLMSTGERISQVPEMIGSTFSGIRDTLRHWFLVVRTAAIGIFVGMVPGLGSAAASWFAYGHALQTEKGAYKTFGKGDIRGVIGVDAAANAKDGGALLPTLFFGIPGSTTMALLLVVFLVHGIEPGPAMATRDLPLTLLIVFSLVLANVFAGLIMLFVGQWIAKLALVPIQVLAPVVISLMAFAAVQTSFTSNDLLVFAAFSFLGCLMSELGWPRPPLLIGLILSPILERYFFISTTRYGYEWLMRPSVVFIGLLAAVIIALVFLQMRRFRQLAGEEPA